MRIFLKYRWMILCGDLVKGLNSQKKVSIFSYLFSTTEGFARLPHCSKYDSPSISSDICLYPGFS